MIILSSHACEYESWMKFVFRGYVLVTSSTLKMLLAGSAQMLILFTRLHDGIFRKNSLHGIYWCDLL